MTDRILYETHSHTPLCGHAYGEPEEYAEVAGQRRLRGIIVTCHNPMPDGFSANVRMAPEEFDLYVDMVQRAREQYQDQVDVRLGLEADYFPGYESWLERQLNSAAFQYVLGSVHPQTAEYRARFRTADALADQRTYFRLLADAAETGLFDCISHPDLIKNEMPGQWNPAHVMEDIEQALDRIARSGVAMELNTSGLNKTVAEMNPFPQMLAAMCQRSIPVVIGADAHVPTRAGDQFPQALDLLQQCGYESVSYFLDRRRIDVPISVARNSLHNGQETLAP